MRVNLRKARLGSNSVPAQPAAWAKRPRWRPRIARTILLSLAGLCGLGRPCPAQPPGMIRHLPPIDAAASLLPPVAPDGPQAHLASDPREYQVPQDLLTPEPMALTSHKDGFFQKLSFTATEVFPDGSGGFGVLETELLAAFALPAPTTEMPLIIIPMFEAQFLDSPSYVELPATLYGPNLDLIWMPRIGPRLKGILSVGAGWYSDFAGSDDGFRLTGRAIARYDWTPDRLQVVLGALYINRYDNKVIPAVGLIWTPSDDVNFELVFPQTKLARRLSWGPRSENWIYLGGGFGGNTWSIVDAAGDPDVLILHDWRITLGWEHKRNGGAKVGVEIGYVFSREIEFASQPGAFRPDSTFLARAIVAF